MARGGEAAVEEPELFEQRNCRGAEHIDAGSGFEEVIRTPINCSRENEFAEVVFDMALEFKIVVVRGSREAGVGIPVVAGLEPDLRGLAPGIVIATVDIDLCWRLFCK